MALYAQKIEREFGISQAEFPADAVEVLAHYEVDFKKVRWYKEIQNEKLSYEAKVKQSRNRYSIEFDSIGNLEDIEKLVSFKKLPAETHRILSDALEKELGKYKIIKTQIQYLNPDNEIKKLADLSPKNSQIRYEIELYSKKDSSKKLMEYLISGKGEIISSREVVIRSSENLTY